MKGLKYIFVKMLAEPLDGLHDNSKRWEFRKLVVSKLAAHNGV